LTFVLPILFVVAVWWLSTIMLLYRTGMPRQTYPATIAGAVVAAGTGFIIVLAVRDDASVAAAYLGFIGALAIWALLEISYLLGFVTGPRPAPCPANATMSQRFGYGVRACLYHELAILGTAAILTAVTWENINKVALWTFVAIWLMRWSTKLNIFLGVRNLRHEFWPTHLQYLQSYARERDMNPLFPFSIAAAVTLIVFLVNEAVAAVVPQSRTAAMLLATILALATVEHLFLMMRVPDDLLWRLGTRARDS
jgi:putative photosynthetic complex assembly protein 2